MPHLSIRALTIAILLGSPVAAHAQLITFDFTGVVTDVPSLLTSGPIASGQTVSGSFTFDPTVADSDVSSVVGLYQNLVAFDVSIPDAGYAATASPGTLPGFIEVLNDEGSINEDTLRDRYVASMTAPDQTVSGPNVAGAPLRRLAILLRDRGSLDEPPPAFSSDALPLFPPSLADFPTETSFILEFDVNSAGPGEVFVTLTSLTRSAVSVPDEIEALAGQVNDLQLAGSINGGQANSLHQKLAQVLAHVVADQARPAVNVLQAFLNQVNAYVRSGRLMPAQGEALTSATQAVITELQNGAP